MSRAGQNRARMSRPAAFLLVLTVVGTACASALTPASRSSPVSHPKAHCTAQDQSVSEPALGWRFCMPGTWHYLERLQPTDAPKGEDATFDITDFVEGPDKGKFGYMIVGTDSRGSAGTLA